MYNNIPDRSMSPPEPEYSGVPCDGCGLDISIGEYFYCCESGDWICEDCKDSGGYCLGCENCCSAHMMTVELAMEVGQ